MTSLSTFRRDGRRVRLVRHRRLLQTVAVCAVVVAVVVDPVDAAKTGAVVVLLIAAGCWIAGLHREANR